jgi:hypothetical protein
MRRRAIAAIIAVVVLLGVILAIVSGGSSPSGRGSRPPGATVAKCPLTDEPAPGGHVPPRPALAVKIGNEPQGARPQSGLNEADIVYDTPAEGFIMRYMAVYQCHAASSIGPTRSVRWVDWHLLAQFGRPILAFAGGIDPDVAAVNSLGWLKGADLLTSAQGAGVRISSRVPPDNLYTSTAALWKLHPTDTTPPPAVFKYGELIPRDAQPASSVAINFSAGTDVVWHWSAAAHEWVHSYSGASDIDALGGKPVTTANVVIQIVNFTYGPYAESTGGTGDVESVTTGTGSGWVLRNGLAIHVTWSRPSTASPTTFIDDGGHAVTLSPGRTWVELLLSTTAAQQGALTFTR